MSVNTYQKFYYPPIVCTACKRVSKSDIAIGSGSTNISLRGNFQNCRYCSNMATIVDGDYNVICGPRGLVVQVNNIPSYQQSQLTAFLKSNPSEADIDAKIAAISDPATIRFLDWIKKHRPALKLVVDLLRLGVDIFTIWP